ncbi:putative LRR receptor-like serine/threonine-protein kinase At1g67720 [Silene latifolia]|uniref:putative LRR receptor-like serine/threonine-protein kinase At1g67720 n=1 Tax=Silene latifolia TaxID=37657 RepID=UPI003D77BA8B
MLIPALILWIVIFSFSVTHADIPAPNGFLLSCGTTENVQMNGLKYVPDHGFISIGNGTSVKNSSSILPILAKLRFFPDKSTRKNCYSFPVIKGAKYLIRTTYYYGEFDGGKEPPIFDQIIDGTRWSVVNTTEDYAKGLASYYELIVAAQSKVLSVCLARNDQTRGESSPFISSIEVMSLDDTLYKAVDFQKYGLSTVARHTFGYTDTDDLDSSFISYPDDEFHRWWEPFKDSNPTVKCQSSIVSSDFWNMPPRQALSSAITTSRGKTLQIQWPPMPLPPTNYYVSLYFQDNRNPSPYSWRVFNVSLNGETFYSKLNVTASGVNVYATQWPLSGQTQLTLTPDNDIPVGPMINAAEMLQLLPLTGLTTARDAMAMEDLDRSFTNPPPDWNGDPCLPKQNSWTGVTCSNINSIFRVSTLNLTGKGIVGSLSPSIGNLTSIVHIWLGNNKLSGSLPDMSPMKMLETLHLENNQFQGSIPDSLATLPRLREIYLQNNQFTGGIPNTLKNRQGLTIRITE